MREHLRQDEMIGYVHRTLTDAEREALDQHLDGCPLCRARLAEHEGARQRFAQTLQAELDQIAPPRSMTFAEVRARMGGSQRRHLRRRLRWRRAGDFLPLGAAVAGLLIALFGLVQQISSPLIVGTPQHATALPTLACILFLIPVMNNGQRAPLLQPRRALLKVLALVLWLGTAVVALYEIYLLREIFLSIYARFWDDPWVATTLGNGGVFILALCWIALVIGGGEFHYLHFGERRSWRLFGWTIVVELLILSLPLFL
jgi:hypothetical protein